LAGNCTCVDRRKQGGLRPTRAVEGVAGAKEAKAAGVSVLLSAGSVTMARKPQIMKN